MRRRALVLLLLVLGVPTRSSAEGTARPSYGPVPAAIAALATTPSEERLAAEALRAIDDKDPSVAAAGARRLLLAGSAGLRRAVERLGQGDLPDRSLLLLLQVVGASPLPAVDGVLSIARSEPLAEARSLAAFGLGAGRTAQAVEALAEAARDPSPAVRAVALRGLYALESPAALATRARLPVDADPAVETLRLRLMRLRGEAGARTRTLALTAWLAGRTSDERLAAMRLLASLGGDAPRLALAATIAELAGPPQAAAVARQILRWPVRTPPHAEARLAAAEALVAWLRRTDLTPTERDALLDLGVAWLAHPVRSRGRPTDEEARALLFAALPEAGPGLATPVVARLARNEFEDPSHGVRLLLALPLSLALESLRSLATAGAAPGVLAAASGGLRDLRRIGDDATARYLLDPARPSEVRTDAVMALEDDDAGRALPLLAGALADRDASVASQAARVLEARGGPREREVLDAALLDEDWRPFEQDVLEHRVAAADDEAFAFLDRALTVGSGKLRGAIFQVIAHPRSTLRGPRALALVRRAIGEPALQIDTGTIGKAIAAVDGKAAVDFIRSRWRTWRSPGVLVRNLRVSTGPEPREFALELAAEIPDTDEEMLKELATVLGESCDKDPARTDPFWRRLLASRREGLERVAVNYLSRVPHGPMSSLLVPIVADASRDVSLRLDALRACAGEPGQPPTALLWRLASDRTEDEDLRLAGAGELLARGDPAVREKALAWLSERLDEPSEAVVRIAEVAGRGATSAQAADLLQMLYDELAARFAQRPYFRARAEGTDAERASRVAALVRGLSAAGDDPSLEAMADLLFDPRFATYSAEARRYEALRHPRGGGPLAALEDPPEIEILLHQAEEDPNDTPASPIPPEASEIIDALARRGVEEASRRIEGAIARARENARLALFQDVYLLWVSNRLLLGRHDETGARSSPAADGTGPIEDALALTWPAAGPEELLAAERRAQRLDREGAWARAAAVSGEAARLAARTGLSDIPPARWLDRGLPPGASWLVLRAQQDLLLGAAAAVDGKPEEARDAFRRGVARTPLDPRVLRTAARLKANVGFDLGTAEAEALLAIELERRQGEAPSGPSRRALQRVRDRQAREPGGR